MWNQVALCLLYMSFFCVCIQAIDVLFGGESTIRRKAFDTSCRKHKCRNLECKNDAGWNIYGYDIGCCGNYNGCCNLATKMCYLHDQMCQCCSFGWLVCGPDCKPEPHCTGSQDFLETDTSTVTSSSRHKSHLFTTRIHSRGETRKPQITTDRDNNNTDTRNTTVSSISAGHRRRVDSETFEDDPRLTEDSGVRYQQGNITDADNQSQGLDDLTANDGNLLGSDITVSLNKSQTLTLRFKDSEGSGEIP